MYLCFCFFTNDFLRDENLIPEVVKGAEFFIKMKI
jgi:hypothetical protein